jgi:hypothetical protein
MRWGTTTTSSATTTTAAVVAGKGECGLLLRGTPKRERLHHLLHKVVVRCPRRRRLVEHRIHRLQRVYVYSCPMILRKEFEGGGDHLLHVLLVVNHELVKGAVLEQLGLDILNAVIEVNDL